MATSSSHLLLFAERKLKKKKKKVLQIQKEAKAITTGERKPTLVKVGRENFASIGIVSLGSHKAKITGYNPEY